MKLYRQIQCSDRLPVIAEWLHTSIGKKYYFAKHWYHTENPAQQNEVRPVWWLEETEITLDDLSNLIQPHAISLEHGEKAAEAIYELLKGEG